MRTRSCAGRRASRVTQFSTKNPRKISSAKAAIGRSALLRSLSLHDRIAQLVIVRAYGDYLRSEDPEYKALVRLIRQDQIGGLLLRTGFAMAP